MYSYKSSTDIEPYIKLFIIVILYFAFWYVSGNHVGPEDVQDQEASVQEGQAEPPHPTVDQVE